MKRRDLLKFGSSAAALTALWSAPAKAADAAPFAWSRGAAAALVGQTFWLNHPDRNALALVLDAVRAPQETQARIDQFSLEFSSDETAIAAATYEFEHAALGHFALFISPAGQGAGNKLYRADFSLLV
jgi:hypothetical protein